MEQEAENTGCLSEAFLLELFGAVVEHDFICSIVANHLMEGYMPGKKFDALLKSIKEYYDKYKSAPTWGYLEQACSSDRDGQKTLKEIADSYSGNFNQEACLNQLEQYIKNVRFQKDYKEIYDLYKSGKTRKAFHKLKDLSDWMEEFTLQGSEFLNVVDEYDESWREAELKRNMSDGKLPVCQFFIPQLDSMNGSRSLRGQLTCFMASTGVGKSHVLRYIGASYIKMTKHIVLHIQLEGSKDEANYAYLATISKTSSYKISTANLTPAEKTAVDKEIKRTQGRVFVRAFEKFGNKVTTSDIRNVIEEFKKKKGMSPDIIIIDSMDLLASRNRLSNDKEVRFDRVQVSQDLKDIADAYNAWVVVSYQSTIENREFLNDETKVLTEYNCAEAKGISRALSHLITLNCSESERKNHIMRLHIAKSRFFNRDEPTVRIVTAYDRECFCDDAATVALEQQTE